MEGMRSCLSTSIDTSINEYCCAIASRVMYYDSTVFACILEAFFSTLL